MVNRLACLKDNTHEKELVGGCQEKCRGYRPDIEKIQETSYQAMVTD